MALPALTINRQFMVDFSDAGGVKNLELFWKKQTEDRPHPITMDYDRFFGSSDPFKMALLHGSARGRISPLPL